MPRLDPGSLARHEARRMAAVLRDVGGHGAPFGEGWAACDERGSWANRAAGLGVHQAVERSTLQALADFYGAQGRPARVQSNTYSHPSLFGDDPVPDGMVGITDRVARHHRSLLYWMELDGQVAGSGGLETFEGAAALFAGCVHPEARKRGLHGAFIRYRLHEARRAGLHCAIIGSEPGGPTERNALRSGFRAAFHQMTFELRR